MWADHKGDHERPFFCFSSFKASAATPYQESNIVYPSGLISVASVHVSASMLTHSAPQEDSTPDC